MPLFDHFHPPLYPHHHWESFHSNWATRIADGIGDLFVPVDFEAAYVEACRRRKLLA